MTSAWAWHWPLIMFVVPTLVALGVAWFFWGGRDSMAGNVAGLFVILIALLLVFGREYAAVIVEKRECMRAGVFCRLTPHEFTRYTIYAGIAFVDIFIVFVTGLWVEQRRRRAG
jgi:hypothetical protein